jgi:two-component system, NarL family, response regulator LiaR
LAESIRILVADDHAVVRKGLQALIKTEEGMEIVGEAENGRDAVALAEQLKPDVILLDLKMPFLDGIEVISQIKDRNLGSRILILTSFADDDHVLPAIKAGALGYLLKDSSPHDLIAAIHHVHNGESSLTPSVALKLVQEVREPTQKAGSAAETLTEREVEVLERVAQGLTNHEIAEDLDIGERTVRNHVGHIFDKLHVANRTQAAVYALREGLATLDSPDRPRPAPHD